MKKFETDSFTTTFLETPKEQKEAKGMKPILSLDAQNILYKTAVFSVFPELVENDPKGFLGFKLLSSRNLKTQKIRSVMVMEYRSDDSKHPLKIPTEELVTSIEEFERKLREAIDTMGNLDFFMKPLISDFSRCKSYEEMVERLKED